MTIAPVPDYESAVSCFSCDHYDANSNACTKPVTLNGVSYAGLNLNYDQHGKLDSKIGQGCPAYADQRREQLLTLMRRNRVM